MGGPNLRVHLLSTTHCAAVTLPQRTVRAGPEVQLVDAVVRRNQERQERLRREAGAVDEEKAAGLGAAPTEDLDVMEVHRQRTLAVYKRYLRCAS